MLTSNVTIKNISVTDAEAETLKRNIRFFCSVPRGTLPQMRDYGIDFGVIGDNPNSVKRRLTVDIIGGIRKYFNVRISRIEVTTDGNGGYTVNIII